MKRQPILTFIKKLSRPVFTTSELSAISAKSPSVTTQALNFLQKEGVVLKIYRGIWAEVTNEPLSPYTVIPFLFSRQRAYLSFVSALHLYGIVEQIPQVITLASTVHTKTIYTKIGIFSVHRIAPSFFAGFVWYKGKGDFLIAEPEKALVDSLYLSTRKKRQYGYFPELHFPKSFSFQKAKYWVKKIPNSKIRFCVQKKLDTIKTCPSLARVKKVLI
jgi:predicted transcriptional regulator of viral defense system